LKKLGVYPNAYYNYLKKRRATRVTVKAKTLKRIDKLYHQTGGKPGYRMMTQLLRNEGIYLSPQTVHKYMNKELGLKSVTRKRKRNYSKGPEPYGMFENLLNQDFHADKRNAKWCVDFTYLSFGKNNRRYNCTILDLYDRRVVASVNGDRINAQLAIDTLKEALRNYGGETGMILHSDRGSQFASKEFIEFCKELGITQSMSKPGCPYDNSCVESFFASLKKEKIYRRKYDTIEEVKKDVFWYIELFYNRRRRHSTLQYMTPVEYLRKYDEMEVA
jgi:transposase InsO family protein